MSAEPEGRGTALKGLEHLFPDEVPQEGAESIEEESRLRWAVRALTPTLTPSGSRSPAGRSSSTVHSFTRSAISPRTKRPPTTVPPYTAARRSDGGPPSRNRTKHASITFPGSTSSKAS